MKRSVSCGNCTYWEMDKGSSVYAVGLCRYDTPHFSDGEGRWPRTEPEDWCGKFESEFPDRVAEENR
jgi:hypothetical protein